MTLLADCSVDTHTTPSSFDLARLVEPVDVTTFKQNYWERKPLHIQRDDHRYYAGLLTLDDVDRLLFLAGVQLDGIRVVMEGKETPIDQLGSHGKLGVTNALEGLYTRYREGSTIVLNSVGDQCEPLRGLAQTLSAEVNARFQMNVYITPGGNAQGFKPHYDTHDVFITQIYGIKQWRLYGTPYALPLHDRRYDKSLLSDLEQEIEMRPGDLLYLPRGTIHAATSTDTASVHITIGVHPVIWSSVIQDTVQKLFAEDVRFRSGLPVGFANDAALRQRVEATFCELIEVMANQLSPREMTTESVKQATSISPPVLRHHLTDLEELPRLTLDTWVRRRPDVRWTLAAIDDVVRLDFHNKSVELPVHVADEVRYVTDSNGDGFTAADIPGDLDEPGRLVLVQALVREGLLTLS
jgi:ribosomal protein L16 Arg81 hydroxylase